MRDLGYRLKKTAEEQRQAILEYYAGEDVKVWIEYFRLSDTPVYCIRSDLGKRMKL